MKKLFAFILVFALCLSSGSGAQAALNFNSSGRLVDCGSASDLDDLGAGTITVWAWVKRVANGANQMIVTKDNSFPSGWNFLVDNAGGEGQVRFVVFRGSTAGNWVDAMSTSGAVALDTWTFVAVASDLAATPVASLYTGTLTTSVAEVTYSLQQNGTGSASTDASANLYVGNLQRATTVPFLGNIARAGVVNRKLTLADLRLIQYASVGKARVSGTLLLLDLFGTGTQPDYSGLGHNGTVTSATAADHVPLGPPFGL